MFEIRRYDGSMASLWDGFVRTAKNGTFLFLRDYMDYHSDRFVDHSLLFCLDGKPYALLPANEGSDGTFYSHQGLTYGGLVMSSHCKAAKVCQLMRELNEYLRSQGFHRVVYKHIPWPYCALPSEEDLFALVNVCHARIVSRDVGSVIMFGQRLPFSQSRKGGVSKARRLGLHVRESNDWPSFWQILEDNLWRNHRAKPVHTLKEIELLKSHFSEAIRLVATYGGERMLGGTVLYETPLVVKTQYISACDEGKAIGAIDVLFDELLGQFEQSGKHYFDFGTSNQRESDDLCDSLIFQKEGFGGRAVCYDTYQWEL